jgi:uncharacterized membrane protein
MTGNFPCSEGAPAEGLEARMQKVSRVVSIGGMGLMFSGFIEMLLNATDSSLALPGAAVLPLKDLIHLQTSSLGLILASAGVIVLCLLPAVRVILALWLYLRLRDLFNTLIAVVVFLELLVSIHIST